MKLLAMATLVAAALANMDGGKGEMEMGGNSEYSSSSGSGHSSGGNNVILEQSTTSITINIIGSNSGGGAQTQWTNTSGLQEQKVWDVSSVFVLSPAFIMLTIAGYCWR